MRLRPRIVTRAAAFRALRTLRAARRLRSILRAPLWTAGAGTEVAALALRLRRTIPLATAIPVGTRLPAGEVARVGLRAARTEIVAEFAAAKLLAAGPGRRTLALIASVATFEAIARASRKAIAAKVGALLRTLRPRRTLPIETLGEALTQPRRHVSVLAEILRPTSLRAAVARTLRTLRASAEALIEARTALCKTLSHPRGRPLLMMPVKCLRTLRLRALRAIARRRRAVLTLPIARTFAARAVGGGTARAIESRLTVARTGSTPIAVARAKFRLLAITRTGAALPIALAEVAAGAVALRFAGTAEFVGGDAAIAVAVELAEQFAGARHFIGRERAVAVRVEHAEKSGQRTLLLLRRLRAIAAPAFGPRAGLLRAGAGRRRRLRRLIFLGQKRTGREQERDGRSENGCLFHVCFRGTR